MSCGIDGCKTEPTNTVDVFCAEHWKFLERRHRTELVKLRNEAARGNRDAVRKYLQAAAVAGHLVKARQNARS